MKTLKTKKQIVKMALGIIALSFVALANTAHAAQPEVSTECEALAKACKAEGFSLDAKQGSLRLIRNCVAPLAQGKTVVSPATQKPVVVPAGVDARLCAPHLTHKASDKVKPAK